MGQRDELSWDFLQPHPGVALSGITSSMSENIIGISVIVTLKFTKIFGKDFKISILLYSNAMFG